MAQMRQVTSQYILQSWDINGEDHLKIHIVRSQRKILHNTDCE